MVAGGDGWIEEVDVVEQRAKVVWFVCVPLLVEERNERW